MNTTITRTNDGWCVTMPGVTVWLTHTEAGTHSEQELIEDYADSYTIAEHVANIALRILEDARRGNYGHILLRALDRSHKN